MIFCDLLTDFTSLRAGGIITYFQHTLFMQNKANFRNDKTNITNDMSSIYEILSRSTGPKNKANSNPIQTQFYHP